jgi:hypothetical protein
VFGLRAGDQNIGSNLELETPEFLFARKVLSRLASGAAGKQREKAVRIFFRDDIVRVGIQPSAVAAEDVHEQKLGSECVRGNARIA